MDFDPRAYPRTYRLAALYRAERLLLGAAIFAIGIALAFMQSPARAAGLVTGPRDRSGDWFALVVTGGIAAFQLVRALRGKIVLTADAVTVTGALQSSQSLRFDQIAEAGTFGFPNDHYLAPGDFALVPNRPGLDPLWIEGNVATDDAFDAWMSRIAGYDALAAEVARATQRAEFRRARAFALQLFFVGVAPILLFFFDPSRPAYAIPTILLPWITIIVVRSSGGLYAFTSSTDADPGNVLWLLCTPGVALAVAAMRGVFLLDWRPMLFAAVPVSGVLAASAMAVDPRLRRGVVGWLTLLLLLSAYGLGASAFADTLLDRSTARVYPVVVQSHELRASNWWMLYRLELAPWGPRAESRAVGVTPRLYTSVRDGDTVCVSLRSGAIAVPWYDVARCARRRHDGNDN